MGEEVWDPEEFEDWLDERLAELCAEVSGHLNRMAEKLGSPTRVWYVNVVDGQVVRLETRGERPRLHWLDPTGRRLRRPDKRWDRSRGT